MDTQAFILLLAAGLAIEAFFVVVKYRDDLNNNSPHLDLTGYMPLYQPVGYMSVGQFLSGGERRWLFYFIFRYIPHAIILILLSAILQRYFPQTNILIGLIITSTVSLIPRDIFSAFRAELISERLLHVANTVNLYVLTVLIWLITVFFDISFIAPTVSGLFDNLWSSLFVATIVVLYTQITNPYTKDRNRQSDQNALDNYVVRSYNDIQTKFGVVIEKACIAHSCSKPILYSVLIYESMNRPKLLRNFENAIVRLSKKPLTVGIAQVRSDRPLTDEESIERAAKILEGSADADSGYGGGFIRLQQLENILKMYNSSSLYAESVAKIMSVLRRYSNDVFPARFGGPIGY